MWSSVFNCGSVAWSPVGCKPVSGRPDLCVVLRPHQRMSGTVPLLSC